MKTKMIRMFAAVCAVAAGMCSTISPACAAVKTSAKEADFTFDPMAFVYCGIIAVMIGVIISLIVFFSMRNKAMAPDRFFDHIGNDGLVRIKDCKTKYVQTRTYDREL